jgi:hypothetical protein
MNATALQWTTGESLEQVVPTGLLPYGGPPADALIRDGRFASFLPAGHNPSRDARVVDATVLIMEVKTRAVDRQVGVCPNSTKLLAGLQVLRTVGFRARLHKRPSSGGPGPTALSRRHA